MAKQVASTLAALADPTRRRVVEHLAAGPRRAGELAARCGLSPPAMSRHLRILRRTGIVEGTESADDARVRLYRLRQSPFSDLRRWLDRLESFWGDQLESFRRHAERSRRERRS